MAPDTEQQSLVTLHFPSGRELFWLASDSPLVRWRVGESVVFRNARWVVAARTEHDGSLVLQLDHDG